MLTALVTGGTAVTEVTEPPNTEEVFDVLVTVVLAGGLASVSDTLGAEGLFDDPPNIDVAAVLVEPPNIGAEVLVEPPNIGADVLDEPPNIDDEVLVDKEPNPKVVPEVLLVPDNVGNVVVLVEGAVPKSEGAP